MAPSSTRKTRNASPIWVGCSGWAYPSWRPLFYPAKAPLKKLLNAYADRLNSVEVNYTFRSLPTPANVDGWLRATPEAFRFSFKAPQRITHFSRLRRCAPLLQDFAESIKPVLAAGRLGVVLFQTPPNFTADATLLDGFLGEAADIFATVAGALVRMAFEFRNASWFANQTYDVLEQHGAALCVAESDELASPDRLTAPFAYYRLRRSDYSEAALDAVRTKLQQRATVGEVFAYFKHEEQPNGPLRAAALLARLRG